MPILASALWNDGGGMDHLFKDVIGVLKPEELTVDHVLLLHGGEDISPCLYNKPVSRFTGADATPSWRDSREWSLLQKAIELGIPTIGICRGAQMLCAAAGGYLIQHVTGHGTGHNVITHDGKSLKVNSLHHQMMAPENTDHELLAWAEHRISKEYYDGNETVDRECEPELIFFNKIKGMAVQWHPEMMSHEREANKYFYQLIKDYVISPQ